MKKNVCKVFYLTAVVFFGPCLSSLANENAVDARLPAVVFQMRSDWEKIRSLEKGSTLLREDPMIHRLESLAQTENPIAEIAAYLLAMLSAKDRGSYQVGTREAHTSQPDIPLLAERMLALLELSVADTKTVEDSRNRVFFFYNSLARLLPVGYWSGWLNEPDDSIAYADVNPPAPSVPSIGLPGSMLMLEIASEFEKADEWDLAWRAYAEGVCSIFGPVCFFDKPLGGTWLSADAARYWIRAGECARQAGREELGKSYLMKAAVFGGEEDYRMVEEILRKWAEEAQAEVEPGPVDEDVRREALTKIVHLYAQANAHPRAFQLFDDYPDVFENGEELRKEIEGQWLAVIKAMSGAASKVRVYGFEVFPNGDPLKVRIPWAFSDEAVRYAREVVQESTLRLQRRREP